MKKNQLMDDRLFGRLSRVSNVLWERQVEIQFMSRNWKVPLYVDVNPKGGIEDNQRLAYEFFTAHEEAVLSAAENAIVEHYRARPETSAASSATSQTVFKLVRLEALTFPFVRRRPTFGILCQCTWDEEHGLAVKFEDGKLTGVGNQDIVL